MPLIYPPLPSWLKYNNEIQVIEGISTNDNNFDTNFYYIVAEGVSTPSRFSLTIYDEKTCDANTEMTAHTNKKDKKGKKKDKNNKKQKHISSTKGLYMNLTVYSFVI